MHDLHRALYEALQQAAFEHCFPALDFPTASTVDMITLSDITRAVAHFADLTSQSADQALHDIMGRALSSMECRPTFTL